MKRKFSTRYQTVLLAFLKQGSATCLQSARGMGRRALEVGLQTLDLAKLHEQILITRVLPGCPPPRRDKLIRMAGIFFTEAITPIEGIRRGAHESAIHLNQIVEMLSERSVELAAANLELEREITRRQAVEAALKQSETHYSQLLAQSDRLQEQLRQLSRKVLSAQEDERRNISRELHDVIAQTLTGINVRLAALAKEAANNTKGLDRNIARTQKMVEKSVDIIHRFARELRPAVLDDLGLIPALHSFLKIFSQRTGLRVHLKACAAVEELDMARRTVLFRVAQEALTNVARHAHASRVEVCMEQQPTGICLRIKDDGKSFQADRMLNGKGSKRLGLLGMRERLEMVGGHLTIDSVAGQGTTILAQIPGGKTKRSPLAGAAIKPIIL
jgi:signal transduction histidine kinase